MRWELRSNRIQDGPFRDCSRMGWGKKASSLKSVRHILQWWNVAQLLPYLKKIQKYIYYVTHLLSSADIIIFSPEISNFCYIKKHRWRLHFNTLFLILLSFFELLKVFLISMVAFVAILKIGYSRPSWNKGISKQRLWRHNLWLWRHRQNFIMWLKLYCSCDDVTKVL